MEQDTSMMSEKSQDKKKKLNITCSFSFVECRLKMMMVVMMKIMI
jgi:hypothetical protein